MGKGEELKVTKKVVGPLREWIVAPLLWCSNARVEKSLKLGQARAGNDLPRPFFYSSRASRKSV